MTMDEFIKKFNAPLIDKRNVKLEDLRPEAQFVDLGLDSLDMVEVIIDFEKNFNITIPDDDVEKLLTVGDAENYLKTRLKIN